MENSEKLYYIAPDDAIFEEMKKCAIKVWGKYSDEFGYRSSKVKRIENLENIRDNFMYIFAMFDIRNQLEILKIASEELQEEIHARLSLHESNYLFNL